MEISKLSLYIQENIYKIIIIVCTVSSNLVIFDRTIVDDLMCFILSLICLYHILKNGTIKLYIHKKHILEIITLSYLLINAVISLIAGFKITNLRGYNQSTIRMILIYICFIVFLISVNSTKQNYKGIGKLLILLSSGVLYCWVIYGLILKSFGINWASQQAKTWAGSSYASIIPIYGLFLSYIYAKSQKNFLFLFIMNYCFSIIASQIFDSRIMLTTLLLLSIYIIIKNLTNWNTSKYVVAFFMFIPIVCSFLLISPNNEVKTIYAQIISLKESSQFINNPRFSDMDRSIQIKCANELIFKANNIPEFLFGFGQSKHKSVMLKCYGVDQSAPGTGVRPVGYAAFLVDYGFLGIFLIFLILIKNLQSIYKAKGSFLELFLVLFAPSCLLLTNAIDSTFIFCIIFLNLIYYFRINIPQFSRSKDFKA